MFGNINKIFILMLACALFIQGCSPSNSTKGVRSETAKEEDKKTPPKNEILNEPQFASCKNEISVASSEEVRAERIIALLAQPPKVALEKIKMGYLKKLTFIEFLKTKAGVDEIKDRFCTFGEYGGNKGTINYKIRNTVRPSIAAKLVKHILEELEYANGHGHFKISKTEYRTLIDELYTKLNKVRKFVVFDQIQGVKGLSNQEFNDFKADNYLRAEKVTPYPIRYSNSFPIEALFFEQEGNIRPLVVVAIQEMKILLEALDELREIEEPFMQMAREYFELYEILSEWEAKGIVYTKTTNKISLIRFGCNKPEDGKLDP